jgi:hypothetical protein
MKTGFTGKTQWVMGDNSKPDIVVEVIRVVPVASGAAHVSMIVVPRAPAPILPGPTMPVSDR